MSKKAMKLALEVLKINLTLLKKINPYKGQEDLLSDSLGLTNKAITTLEAELAKPDFWEGYVPEPDKRQQALDKKAENARELGLDYEPAQQEPVALKWQQSPIRTAWGDDMVVASVAIDNDHTLSLYCERDQTPKVEPMFAQRTWVGLTDEEYGSMYNTHLRNGGPIQNFTRAIEAKLRSKNT